MSEQAGEPIELLEPSNVARELGLSYSWVRLAVQADKLKPYAVTPRGMRLFHRRDVEALRQARAAR